MRNVYAIQPYEVGTKNHKGLAIYIPIDVKKKCGINTSSIFNLKISKKTNKLLLYGPNNPYDRIDLKNQVERQKEKKNVQDKTSVRGAFNT